MKSYKAALIQMSSEFGNIQGNVNKATQYVREAAHKGAKLIMLPEMFNTGLDFNKIKEGMAYAESLDGSTLTHMRGLAKELGAYILCPLLIDIGDNKCENTACLIDDTGVLLGSYAKTHPVGDERIFIHRGDRYPVFDTKLGKIGLSICYDMCFPETSRILAINGAEVVLVVAAWRGSHYFKEWWDINMQCRAIDNLVYVLAVNQCGATGDDTEMYAGKSQVINPIGQVQKMAGVEEEVTLYQDIYLDRVERDQAFNTVLIDRHIEDYVILSQK